MKKKILITIIVILGVILIALASLLLLLTHRVDVEDSMYGDVVVLPTYEKVHHGYTQGLFNFLDEGSECTVAATVDENGHMIVGRNLDLEVSMKPIFLFRTKQKDCYETIGLANFAGIGDDADVTIEKGVQNWYYQAIPDIAADVMNEKGLYIEMNERMGEYDDDGNFLWACDGTNPDSDVRVPDCCLSEYLVEHCADVDEAIDLAKEIDIYSFIGLGMECNYAYMMADASGHYGVLEVVDNKVIWNEGAAVNTNYYFAKGYAEKARFGQGQGRQEVAEEELPNVNNLEDMQKLMEKVSYFQIIYPDECQYDCRYEYTHEVHDWTVDDLLNPDNQEELMKYINKEGDWAKGKTRKQIAENGEYFESVYTNLVDCTDKTFTVYTHENPKHKIKWGF